MEVVGASNYGRIELIYSGRVLGGCRAVVMACPNAEETKSCALPTYRT